MPGCVQDMPPVGGYSPVIYHRVPPRVINVWWKVGVGFGVMIASWAGFIQQKRKTNYERIEMNCGRIALMPMLRAESDRAMLKQIKKNRDLEAEVMKNVKGWEVGMLKKEPIYHTVDLDEFFKPSSIEYYMHAGLKQFEKDYWFSI